MAIGYLNIFDDVYINSREWSTEIVDFWLQKTRRVFSEAKMIEAIENSNFGFEPHEDHGYIEGLFYSQIENLTRGRVR